MKTPILYLAFNRIDHVKRTFKKIKEQRPEKLFVSVDGGRNEEEKVKVQEVKDYIIKEVDWKCTFFRKFNNNNKGCELAVKSAVDWFFSHIEKGIIIEDDCLCSKDFFRFCEELLVKYEDNKKILTIYGTTPINLKGNSYDFIHTVGFWGWATWRDRWQGLYNSEQAYQTANKNMKISNKYIKEVYPNIIERVNYGKKYKDYLNGKVDTWEYPLQLGSIRRKYLNCIPSINLVKNIGIYDGFTNTKPNKTDKKYMTFEIGKLDKVLKHPTIIKANNKLRWSLVFRDYKRIINKRIIR